MREDIYRYIFDIFHCLNDQTGANISDHSWCLYQKLSEKSMIHLFHIPFTLRFIFQVSTNDSIIVWNVLVFIFISKYNSMEVEHGKLETLFVFKTADIVS
jgi:hypothetical protein